MSEISKANEGIKALEDLFDLGDADKDLEDVYSEDVGDATFEDKKEEINELLREEKEENGETKKASTKDAIKEAISAPQVVDNKEVINEKESEKVTEKTEEEKGEKPNIVEEENDDELDFDTSDSFMVEDDEVEEKEELKEAPKEPKLHQNKDEETGAVKPRKRSKRAQFTAAEVRKPPADEPPKQETQAKEVTVEEAMEVEPKKKPSHHWRVTPTDAKFTAFYKMKKERIEKFLSDGEIPYDLWVDELMKARVNLSSLVYDLDHLSTQMQQVQQHQYRVAEIRMRINTQYNWCKRSLELLRGRLAQIAYEKPIEKFNGVIYEHLYDVEDYLQKLETVKENAEIVTKNLDKAAEVISRRVTVVMMEAKTDSKGRRYTPKAEDDIAPESVAAMQPVDLSEAEEKKQIEEEDDDLDDFDTLEVNVPSEEEKPKKPKDSWGLVRASMKKK